MKITFLGAAHEVTGSHYIVELDSGFKMAIDCGLFQGTRTAEDKNFSPFPYDPESIDVLLLTHAHLDHTGRLPKLVKDGFQGKIFTLAPTQELTSIVLEDAVGLMEDEAKRDAGHEPLYAIDDVLKINAMYETVTYNTSTEIAPGVHITYLDAGHILGSASISITAEGQTIAFSGDLGNPPVPLLDDIEPVKEADILVIESTYGGRLHESGEQRQKLLADAITQTIKDGGTLMIPAFAIERTQEILYEINHLIEHNTIPQIPVFLDSPMAIEATNVFRNYSNLYNDKDKAESKQDDFFNFPGLKITATVDASKSINNVTGPKIIIAGAGMMTGGRILHHAIRYLVDPKSTLLIVGFQVEGSLGRRLLDGDKDVKIHGQDVHVRARIAAIGAYSAHADQKELLEYIEAINKKPKKIFITHGEISQSQIFAQKITNQFGVTPTIPELGETFEL